MSIRHKVRYKVSLRYIINEVRDRQMSGWRMNMEDRGWKMEDKRWKIDDR